MSKGALSHKASLKLFHIAAVLELTSQQDNHGDREEPFAVRNNKKKEKGDNLM